MAIAYQDQATSQAGAKTTTIAATAPTAYRIGSRGDAVATYQKRLTELGYNTGTADGIYGNMTAAAVKQFQSDHGLVADGILGSQTIAAMISANTAKENIQAASATNEMNTVGSGAPVAQPTASQTQTELGIPHVAPAAPPSSQQLGAQAQQTSASPESWSYANGGLSPEEVKMNQWGMGIPTTPQTVAPAAPATPSPDKGAQDGAQYQSQIGGQQASSPDLGYNAEFSYQPTPVTQPTVQPMEQAAQSTASTSRSAGIGLAITKSPTPTVQAAQTGAQSGTEASPEQLASAAATTGIQSRYTQLFDQLNTMTPEWNPDADPDYQRDAAKLENKVTQMMVARGGLYSSVARAALQSGLTDLELGYRKQAYERFTSERTFVFQQLQFVAQRIDAEFEKAMAVKNYELAVQKEEFDQRMAIAQFKADQAAKAASLSIQRAQLKASQENAAAQKQLADAARQQQQTYNSLKQQEAMLNVKSALLSSAKTKFANGDYLNGEELSMLGLDGSSSYWDTVNALNRATGSFTAEVQTWRAATVSLGDAQTTLEAYSDVLPKSNAPSGYEERTVINDDGTTTTTYVKKWG